MKLLDKKQQQALDAINTHPLHHENLRLVEGLIADLRNGSTLEDLYLLQKKLFSAVQSAEQEQQKAEDVAESAQRLRREVVRRGGGTPDKVKLWELQQEAKGHQLKAEVLKRIRRELRSVGDGLLWTAVGFDRGYILGIANAPGGGNLHLSDERGLAAELDEVERLWRSGEALAMMHDLTNCARIGDLTLVRPGRIPQPKEVKRSQAIKPRQQGRLTDVQRFVRGVPVPLGQGTSSLLRSIEGPMRNHLDEYGRVLLEAGTKGAAGAMITSYLGMTAVNFLHSRWDLLRDADVDETLRERLFMEAWMPAFGPLHKTILSKNKLIPRSVPEDSVPIIEWDASEKQELEETLTGAPFPIYPFTPDVCAFLTCGYLKFSLYIDMDAFIKRLRWAGFDARAEFPYIWLSRPKFARSGSRRTVDARLGKDVMQQILGEGMSAETVAAVAKQLFSAGVNEGTVARLRYFEDRVTWNRMHLYTPQLEFGGRDLLLKVGHAIRSINLVP